MKALSAAVGEQGANKPEDVALVQAILVSSRRPKKLDPKEPAYLGAYDAIWSAATKKALELFQSDQVFVSADGDASVAVANATPGRVAPGDATWRRLCEAPPPEFRDLRVLSGGRTVYQAASADDLAASLQESQLRTFHAAFRLKLTALFNQVHANHGIVLRVCPGDGARRTFEAQDQLLNNGTGVTNAGPGESNHNYGRAGDFGFPGLRWLRANGAPVTNEDPWMHKLEAASLTQANLFWKVLRDEGESAAVSLFHGPVGDRPHLQASPDSQVSMNARLGVHLTRCSVSGLVWSGKNGVYGCNLGFDSALQPVGRATAIWHGNATVTSQMLSKARTAPLRPQLGGGPPRPSTGFTSPALAAQAVAEMKQRLRADFVAADLAWTSWTPN